MLLKRSINIPRCLLIISALFVFYFEGTVFFRKVSDDLTGFAVAKFNYLNVHRFRRASFTGLKARSLLPEDAQVEISGPKVGISRVAMRYQLYPLRIVEDGTHFLDWQQTLEKTPAGWIKKELPTDRNLYAKPGYGFRDSPSPLVNFPLVYAVMFSVFFVIFNIYIGWILLSLLKGVVESGNAIWLLATSYLLGFLFLTLTLWVFMLCGGHLTQFSLIIVWGAVAGTLAVLAKHKKVFSNYRQIKQHEPYAQKKRLSVMILKSMAFTLIASIFLTSIVTPVNDWDGMSHWIFKSKVLFFEQNFNFDYTHSNYYPILWPLNIGAQFALLGGMYDELAQWTSAFIFICLMIQFIKCLEILRVSSRAKYCIVISFLLTFFKNPHNPRLLENFVNTNAENLFLAYLLAILVAVIVWLKDQSRREYLILGVVLAVGLSLTKMEGAAVTVFLGSSLLFVVRQKQFSMRAQKDITLFFGVIILPILWVLWVWKQGYFSNIYHTQNPITFLKITALGEAIAANFLNSNMSYILLLAALFMIFYSKFYPYDVRERFFLIFSLFLLSFCCCATFGWSIDKIRLDLHDVTARLFLHASLPLTMLFASRTFAQED